MYPRTYQSIPSNAYDTTAFHQQHEKHRAEREKCADDNDDDDDDNDEDEDEYEYDTGHA